MPAEHLTTQSLNDLEGSLSDISDFVDKADFVALMPNVEGETSRQKLKELAARMYLTFTHKAAYNPDTTSEKAFKLLSVVAVLGAAEELSSRVVHNNTRFNAEALEQMVPDFIPNYRSFCEAGVCGANPNCSLQKFCCLMVRMIDGMRTTYKRNKGLGLALTIKRAVEADPNKEEGEEEKEAEKKSSEKDKKGGKQDKKGAKEEKKGAKEEKKKGDKKEEKKSPASDGDSSAVGDSADEEKTIQMPSLEEPTVTFQSFMTSTMAAIKKEIEGENPVRSPKEKIDVIHKHLCRAFQIAPYPAGRAKRVAYTLCEMQDDGSPFYEEHGPLLFVAAGLDSISNSDTNPDKGFKPFFAGFCTFSLEQLKDMRRALNKCEAIRGGKQRQKEPVFDRDDSTMVAKFGSRESRAAKRGAAMADPETSYDLSAFWAWKLYPFDFPDSAPELDLTEYDVYKTVPTPDS